MAITNELACELALKAIEPKILAVLSADSSLGLRFDAQQKNSDVILLGKSWGNPGAEGREFLKLNQTKLRPTVLQGCPTEFLDRQASDGLIDQNIHLGAGYVPRLGLGISFTGFGPAGNVLLRELFLEELNRVLAAEAIAAE